MGYYNNLFIHALVPTISEEYVYIDKRDLFILSAVFLLFIAKLITNVKIGQKLGCIKKAQEQIKYELNYWVKKGKKCTLSETLDIHKS